MSINKQNIKKLLDKRNIKKVVYVDDDFYTDLYESNFRTYVRENCNNTIEFPFIIVPDDEDVSVSNFDYWWKNTEASIKREFIDNLKIDRNKSEIESRLEQAFDADILQCISHIEFKKIFNNGSEHEYSNDNQLLVLMDKDLGGEDGLKYLSPLQDVPFIACGLFSGTFKIEEEIKQWEQHDYPSNIYPLAKERLTVIEEDFLPGLRNVLWLRQISDSKKKINTIYKNALELASSELSHLDPASFDNAIIQRSKGEGCWEFDMLQRILNILLRINVEKSILKTDNFEDIQSLTGKLKEISSSSVPVRPDPKTLKDIRYNEIYDNPSYINKTYSQIALGDIFQIQTGKYRGKYMLVCQPCNLEIRGNGERLSKEFVYLLPIKPKPKYQIDIPDDANVDKIKEIVQEQLEQLQKPKYVSVLQDISGEQAECVILSQSIRVSPKVLDLVCFNDKGKAQINPNQTVEQLINCDFLQPNMKKRYDKIRIDLKKYLDLCSNDEINGIPEPQKIDLLNLIRKPFELATKESIKAKFNPESQLIEFNIERIGRYREAYAQLVLKDFMDYQSRQAYPNDFSIIDDEFYNAEETKPSIDALNRKLN